jgi:flagellin
MSVVINSNTAASVASNNLAYSTSQLQNSLNKLSSGSKIVNPSDDAGGLAVSMKLTATVNRESDLEDNISNANSFLQTQDGALQVAGSVLDRMSQLQTLYQDPTKNSSDQANYDDEFTQLQSELKNISSSTFNGVALFGSTTSQSLSVYTDDSLSSSQAVSIKQQDLAPPPWVWVRSLPARSPAWVPPGSTCPRSPTRSKMSRRCARSTAPNRAA